MFYPTNPSVQKPMCKDNMLELCTAVTCQIISWTVFHKAKQTKPDTNHFLILLK